MGDGSAMDVQRIPYGRTLEISTQHNWSVTCSKVSAGRSCSLIVDDIPVTTTVVLAVHGDIFGPGQSMQFGDVYGWKFIGDFISVSICNERTGSLQQQLQ